MRLYDCFFFMSLPLLGVCLSACVRACVNVKKSIVMFIQLSILKWTRFCDCVGVSVQTLSNAYICFSLLFEQPCWKMPEYAWFCLCLQRTSLQITGQPSFLPHLSGRYFNFPCFSIFRSRKLSSRFAPTYNNGFHHRALTDISTWGIATQAYLVFYDILAHWYNFEHVLFNTFYSEMVLPWTIGIFKSSQVYWNICACHCLL